MTATLLRKFENATLQSLPHEHHVRVAYLLTRKYPREQVNDVVLAGFRKLAPALGLSPASIHVTMTVAWTQVIAGLSGQGTSEEFLERHPELLRRDVLNKYYSAGQLHGGPGRTKIMLPDRLPFPQRDPEVTTLIR
jgi:hypothetical protein